MGCGSSKHVNDKVAKRRASAQNASASGDEPPAASLATLEADARARQTPEGLQMIEAVFRYYDRDKDGQLTIKELRQGLQNTDLNIENYLGADADGDGMVSMAEWVMFFEPVPEKAVGTMRKWLLQKQTPAAKEMLLDVYNMLDKDGDQKLTFDEISSGIKGSGLSPSSTMAGADLDGDNLISKEEWIQYFDPIPDNEIDEVRAWLTKGVAADAANGKLAQPGAASEPSADASPLVASQAQPNTETAASTDDGSRGTSQFDHTPLPAIGNC